jgi:hypothetical protein
LAELAKFFAGHFDSNELVLIFAPSIKRKSISDKAACDGSLACLHKDLSSFLIQALCSRTTDLAI